MKGKDKPLKMLEQKENVSEWILCPVCHNRTRIKVRTDTVLLKFPLFCPKCKREILINVVDNKICIVEE